MSETNETEGFTTSDSPIDVSVTCQHGDKSPHGSMVTALLTMSIVAGLSTASLIYREMNPTDKPNCKIDNALTTANLNAQTAQIKFNGEQQKRQFEIQLKVIEVCVAKGGVPTFNGSFTDCKIQK